MVVEILVLTLRSISPLDAGTKVELKFDVETNGVKNGEFYLRVEREDEHLYKLGDVYSTRLHRL